MATKKIQAVPKINARGEAKVSNIFELMVNSAILGRAQLASVLGMSYGTDRDIYQALGYDTDPTWTQYVAQYSRQGFAAAVIDRPVQSTWGRGFQLVEAGDDEETELERAWKDLEKRLGLTSMFARLDRLTGLGTYGVLLLGLSDVSNPQDFRKPALGKGLQLKYVRPFSGMSNQGDAQISQWVTDPSNERYGRPELYSITLKNLSTGDQQIIEVHHSRVIHVADGLGSSEIEGTPRLQAVWNNLKNLEKIVGGSAEMYWRGARPGYALEAEKDFQIPDALLEDLQAQMDEYEHNLRRMLALQGMKVNPLAQQVVDPSAAVDVQIQEMSATTGIPKRILTGSERGELASSQDRENQSDYIEDRQLNFAEPRVARASIDRFIELGVLPPVSTEEGYSIQWPDTREPSDMDRAKVGAVRATAIKDYASAPTAEAVVPVQSFLRICLGLTDDEITLVEEEKAAAMAEEGNEPELEPEPEGGGPKQKEILTQMRVDQVDWKKVYEDGGAHWVDDLQSTKFAQEFAQRLVAEGKQSVLEIGCGNGRDSILFAVAGMESTGIDLVPEAVALAKQNAERVGVRVNFREGNAEALDFPDSSFDAVYSLSVLHSTDMSKSIPDVARVLKYGGLAFIYIYSDVSKIDGSRTEFVSIDEWVGLLRTNGFSLTDIYTIPEEEFDEAGEKHSIIVTWMVRQ